MFFKVLPFLVVAALSLDASSGATDKVVCYYGSWSYWRVGNGKFTIDNIDPNICTHVIYSFVGINSDGSIKILDSYLELDLGNLAKLATLKKSNSKVKTLVAIGGWNEGSVGFSAVAASKTLRTNLINSAISLIETYGLDGFDLDWEYPAQRGGSAADKANFATLIKEFRTAFDKKGLLLTAAVAASASSVDLSYDVPALSKYLDFINVMAYDLHGAYDGVTGQNAPLYASSIDVTANQKLLNVDACIKGWIQRGAAPSKLVLGLGSYGRSYTLSSSSNNKLGAPVSNNGNQGPYTGESGMLGYNEIIEKLAAGWTEVWDDEQKVPYAYSGNQWVGYDNPRSIGIKATYAKELGLGGVMLWSIETEDFRGVSGTKFPLLKAAKAALSGSSNENIDNSGSDSGSNNDSDSGSNNGSDSGSNSGSDSDSNNESDSGSNSGSDNTSTECTQNGYIKNPEDCSKFFYCQQVGSTFAKYAQFCPSGLVFNAKQTACDWPANVQC